MVLMEVVSIGALSEGVEVLVKFIGRVPIFMPLDTSNFYRN